MTGTVIAIDDAAAADTVLSVKQRVFAFNRKLFVRRQRLVYTAGPSGMDALADDETLGGAGVAQDGSAKLDVLLADLSEAEAADLGKKVRPCQCLIQSIVLFEFSLFSALKVSISTQLHVSLIVVVSLAAIDGVGILLHVFAPTEGIQLLEAAQNGRAYAIAELLAEGVNIEFKDQVHSFMLVSMGSSHV